MLGGPVLPVTEAADHLRRAHRRAGGDRARPRGAVRAGGSAPLVVQGEPGIGKTRLLAELAGRAEARGCTVLGGSASELERDLPFWVFVDALDEYVAGLDPQLVASLRDEVRSELAHVLPSLSELAPAARRWCRTSATAPTARCASCSSGSRRAGRWCSLLDDVHWADAASVELLAALLRSPPDAAVLLVMAARPRQWPRASRDGARARRPSRRPDPARAGRARARGGRRAARRRRRARAGGRALRGGGRQPVLPPAARPLARRRRRRRRAPARRSRPSACPPR